MRDPLRILIVDDSALVRRTLRQMLESDPDIQVIGEAADGQEALACVQNLRPDLITMDVRMPVMDGLETTEQLMAYHPTPILVVTGSLSRYDVDITFKMLGAGALEVVEKPDLSNPNEIEKARRELIRRIKTLARVKVVTHLRGRRRNLARGGSNLVAASTPPAEPVTPPQPIIPKPAVLVTRSPDPILSLPPLATEKVDSLPLARTEKRPDTFPLVIIGASTGGPKIVKHILAGLPARFGAAVIVVQHIAEGFSTGMVEWLSLTCQLPVFLAYEGAQIIANTVMVTPDGYNLYVKPNKTVHLNDQPCLLRPSVDITMQTAVPVFGSRIIGVLLSGMGRDGAIGMQTIHRAGGYTLAQDEATCTIYGMPRAAYELDAVDEMLPPEGILQAIKQRVSKI
ncbi:MAG: chemotaxis-specific protein-glutamate methyltransferase CheB [Chloroflexaceae bacterium]|nr:chemotaxis-specific protein-glutamate methyltransferase CheB [Chloroflexaceae bacterium]